MLGYDERYEKRGFSIEHEGRAYPAVGLPPSSGSRRTMEDKSANSVESLGEGGRTINHPYAHNLGKK